MSYFSTLVSAVFIAGIWAGSCDAKSAPLVPPRTAPAKIALLIGNWDYNLNAKFDDAATNNYVGDLKGPCKDVDLIKGKLKKYNFQIETHCNVNRSDYTKITNDFTARFDKLPTGSIVFVYYSGHGMQLYGHGFTVPVLFQWDYPRIQSGAKKDRYLAARKGANEIVDLFDHIKGRKDIAVVVAFDACRDDPVSDEDFYNNRVKLVSPPNAVVQFATTPSDRATDDSDYALILANALDKGGNIGNIMASVYSQLGAAYDQGDRATPATSDVGYQFIALEDTAIDGKPEPGIGFKSVMNPNVFAGSASVKLKLGSGKAGPTAPARKKVRDVPEAAGVKFDILWCEGPNGKANYQYASSLALRINEEPGKYGIGRIQTVRLDPEVREDGYNVARNLMRYDPKDGLTGQAHEENVRKELAVIDKVSKAFPDGHFLPQKGIGSAKRTFHNYVSAFVCERVED